MGRRAWAGLVALAALALLVAFFFLRDSERRSASESTAIGGGASPVAANAASLPATPGERRSKEVDAAASRSSRSITGRVVDRAGRAIAGAHVAAVPFDAREFADEKAAGVESAADGAFEISTGDDGAARSLFASRVGFSPAVVEPARPGEFITLTLDASRSIAGRVFDRDGRPIANARLRWTSLLGLIRVDREARSAEDGRYRIADVPDAIPQRRAGSAVWAIEVRADGFAPLLHERWVSEDEENRASPRDGDVELDLYLVRGAMLRGKVVDDDSGLPISGAPVLLGSYEGLSEIWRDSTSHVRAPTYGRTLATAVTSADGTFVFDHVPSRGVHPNRATQSTSRGTVIGFVGASPSDHAPACDDVVLLRDGESTEVTLRCAKAGNVVGRVLDSRGRPRPGTIVTSNDRYWHRHRMFFEAIEGSIVRTDRDGRYRVERVPTKTSRITAFDADSISNESAEVEVRAGETLVAPDIAMPAMPSAELHVTDLEGRPIAGATAVLGGVQGYQPSTRTGADGVARLESLGVATGARFFVRARGFADGVSEEFATSEENPPVLTLRLRPEKCVTGKLLRADGAPHAHGFVKATSTAANPAIPIADSEGLLHSGIFRSSETAADGSFRIEGLPPGPVRLVAFAHVWDVRDPPDPETMTEAEVLAGRDDVVLTLPIGALIPPSVEITGSIVDERSGRPIVPFLVTLRDGKRSFYAERIAPGRFRLRGDLVGKWTVTAEADGWISAELRDFEVTARGAERSLDLRLSRGGTVRGIVRGPERIDLSCYRIKLTQLDRPDSAEGRIESGGRFVVSGLPPGRYVPFLEAYDWGTSGDFLVADPPVEAEVSSGTQEMAFDFTVVVGQRVNVYVLRGGLPAKGARIEIVRAGRRFAVWHDVHEGFRGAACLAPGRYDARLLIENSVLLDEPVETVKAEGSNVMFR